jgi:hypothetical protein
MIQVVNILEIELRIQHVNYRTVLIWWNIALELRQCYRCIVCRAVMNLLSYDETLVFGINFRYVLMLAFFHAPITRVTLIHVSSGDSDRS